MKIPRPSSRSEPTSPRSSASSASREGIGSRRGRCAPARCSSQSRWRPLGFLQRPASHRLDFGRLRRALGRRVAHDISADRRMADENRDVDSAALALEHLQVLRDGFEIPAHTGAQHLERHALDLREVLHHELAVARAAGRDGEAAVADDRRGDAERRRGRRPRIPGELRVVVRMVIDDAGHEREPVAVDRFLALPGSEPNATMRPSFTATLPRRGSEPRPSSSSASRIRRSNMGVIV